MEFPEDLRYTKEHAWARGTIQTSSGVRGA